MRKHQQTQLFELLQTLGEAHDELAKQTAPGVVTALLSRCQDFALKIGEHIENIEGEGTQAVALLVEYCELAYQASVESGANHLNKLQMQLVRIESAVRNELKPNRIEIVFFPYQLNMWDSFESIYLAAKDDPQCDAYVVPIPWFEKLPDGSLGTMHYDGDNYSKDIPITDWRNYDLEARHPDVVFVHNPYDESNNVTSVHPVFYCKRLKNFTDLLCYVPYFVCADDVLEHFCVNAGTLHAGRVIVQSEKVRQTYIRVFKEFEKENHCQGKFGVADEKFIALGSPKFDKVINTKREDCELPEAWAKLMDDKKVVLYNTTVGGILQGNEQHLKKIRYVLDTFRKRDDVVLWWRPHPLSEATYQSMRPQLFGEYERIVAEYKREVFGIYDDTIDLHRALAWSDAYYGDGSSLMAMYGVTGKPIMLQNAEIVDEDDEYGNRVLFNSFFDDGVDIWFTVRLFNALFKMNKKSWTPEYVGSFPDERNSFLYGGVPVSCNGHLYFPPSCAKGIMEYSPQDMKFSKILYKNSENKPFNHRDFFGAVVLDKYVYFTPHMYPAIIRLDTVTHETEYYSDWLAPLQERIYDNQDAFFFQPLNTGHNTFMLPACCTNAVVEFDMNTHRSVIYEVGRESNQYGSICFDGENYWLSPRHDTPVVKWNPETGMVKEFTEINLDDKDTQFAFLPILYLGGYVWLLPRFAKHAVKIDVRTDTVTIAKEFELDLQEEKNIQLGVKYHFAQISGDSIFAYNKKNSALVEYNCKTKVHREEIIRYPPEITARLESLIMRTFLTEPGCYWTGYYYCEDGFTRLREFVNYLVQREDSDEAAVMKKQRMAITRGMNVCAGQSSGEAIYACIRSSLRQEVRTTCQAPDTVR
jgi:hypothetical protein